MEESHGTNDVRTARRHDKPHLDFIRQQSCMVCGDDTSVEAAHIRYADARIAKPITGVGIKPDDRFVVPLCGRCHRGQHSRGERAWWQIKQIDPILIALALFSVSGDYDAGAKIVAAALRFQR